MTHCVWLLTMSVRVTLLRITLPCCTQGDIVMYTRPIIIVYGVRCM